MSAKRSVWRMHDHAGEGDKEFKQQRGAVLEGANYSCVFCQMKSAKYQEVHHVDDDHKNNDPANLTCTCPLCHQIFHIGLAGMKNGGEIVYLPELAQVELNQLAFVMWLVTEADGVEFKDAQQAALFTRLSGRARAIEGVLGNRRGTVLLRLKAALEGTSFPQDLLDKIKLTDLSLSFFSNVLMGLSDDDYSKRKDLLGGLRIYPWPDRFRERITFWSAEQSAVLPAPVWYNILPQDAVASVISECAVQLDAMLPIVSENTAESQ